MLSGLCKVPGTASEMIFSHILFSFSLFSLGPGGGERYQSGVGKIPLLSCFFQRLSNVISLPRRIRPLSNNTHISLEAVTV